MGSLQVTELHIKVQLKFIMEINRRTKNRRRGSDLKVDFSSTTAGCLPTTNAVGSSGSDGRRGRAAGLVPGLAAEPSSALGLTQSRQPSVSLRTQTETGGRVASRTERGLPASWPPRLCQGVLGTAICLLLWKGFPSMSLIAGSLTTSEKW